MSQRNPIRITDADPPNSPQEVSPPRFVMEISPETVRGREPRYVANDAVSGRFGHPGVIAELRDALREANGKTVVITITTK